MKTFIIDDDPICNMITELILQQEEFSQDITIFEAAEDALASLADCSNTTLPKVILLDINMPLMNGWQFLDSLSAYEQKLKNHCSVYMLTSSFDPYDMKKAEDYLLVKGFFHKPLQESNIKTICEELGKKA